MFRILPAAVFGGIDTQPELAVFDFELRRNGDAIFLLRLGDAGGELVFAFFEPRDGRVGIAFCERRNAEDDGSQQRGETCKDGFD